MTNRLRIAGEPHPMDWVSGWVARWERSFANLIEQTRGQPVTDINRAAFKATQLAVNDFQERFVRCTVNRLAMGDEHVSELEARGSRYDQIEDFMSTIDTSKHPKLGKMIGEIGKTLGMIRDLDKIRDES